MKIIPLSEGAFTIDITKQFIPFDIVKDKLQQRPAGSLLVEIQPFVIITAKDIILIDTGLGFADEHGVMQIHKNLLQHGIHQQDVTKVLMSHLHKDHASGIINKKKSRLSFTNATYFINKQEFDFANENTTASYTPEDFLILKNSPQVNLIEGDGIIDDYIKYEETGAHCPYHQVFWIEEDGEKIFFGGDVAPQLHQMKNKFIAKYDYDGRKCMELRKQWRQQGEEEKWTFLFYHDLKNPIYKF